MALASWLSRENTIAPATYNRWRVPPAALAVHLCIGQVYAFSVFNLPLSQVIGIDHSASNDWSLTDIGWIFSLAAVFLGIAAAFGGRWLETVGPRKAMAVSAVCFGGGLVIASIGVSLHQLWLVYLGYGVISGIGLGIGYISPVSTLIKWFPDRPGLATGLAIMGFGGGAMLGAPLSVALMDYFATPESVGVAPTFLVMGVLYFLLMIYAAYLVKVPPIDWHPKNFVAKKSFSPSKGVDMHDAMFTPQFWLLWIVLCFSVTAGVGVLGQASLMIQEIFGSTVTVAAAAGFVGLLSLFNMAGRFLWASASDYLGRKVTFTIFLLLGAVLYALVPGIGLSGNLFLFIAAYALIISMYGGSFATIPAYLRDVFGVKHVGAIHGRLLTAWSVAGVLGPVLINYLREYQLCIGVPPVEAYSLTFYIMAGLLVIGFIALIFVKPVQQE